MFNVIFVLIFFPVEQPNNQRENVELDNLNQEADVNQDQA